MNTFPKPNQQIGIKLSIKIIKRLGLKGNKLDLSVKRRKKPPNQPQKLITVKNKCRFKSQGLNNLTKLLYFS